MTAHCLYAITNRASGKAYIGQSVNPKHRMSAHCAPNARPSVIGAALKKYSRDGFVFEIIATGLSPVDANHHEEALIAHCGTLAPAGYNVKPGGSVARGWKMSPEARAKMSVARKGKARSAESCLKTALALRGRPLSQECKQKLSRALAGRRIVDSVRAHMSAGQKQRYNDPDVRKKRSEDVLRLWADPGFRDNMLAARVAGRIKRDNAGEKIVRNYSIATRAALRKRLLEQRKNPEIEKRRLAGLSAIWADPDFRKRHLRAVREASARLLAQRAAYAAENPKPIVVKPDRWTPEARLAQSAKIKAAWAHKKIIESRGSAT